MPTTYTIDPTVAAYLEEADLLALLYEALED
jgi:hypothetical protein